MKSSRNGGETPIRMTEITSKRGQVSRTPFELYMMFVDMRNFLSFIPEDKRQEVIADYDTLTVTIQGFKLRVMIKDRRPYSEISFIDDGAPFQFSGSLHFDAVPDNPAKTDFHIEFCAELNLMMKLWLGNKLREVADKIVDGLVAVSEGRLPEGMDEETLRRMQEELDKRQ